MKPKNYYRILGIARNASGAEIKRAYRTLAHRFHPDVSTDPDGKRKFQAIAEAYRTLKCPETRATYNRQAAPAHDDRNGARNADLMRDWYALFQWPAWAWYWPR